MEKKAESKEQNTFTRIYNILKACTKVNVVQRTIIGLIMLQAFIFLCKGYQIYIMIFTVFLTLGICHEIILLAKKPGKPLALHSLQVIFMVLIVYMSQVLPLFTKLYPVLYSFSLIAKSRAILFSAYACVFMVTILSFRKYNLSSQLLIFSMCHLAAYILGLCCAYACLNIKKGSFYFFYPCILVISNDIFAYIIGKWIGKTPLYPLSPKKTIEGFIGASFFTFLVGIFMCYLKVHRNFMPDDFDSLMILPFRTNAWRLNIPVIYLHNLVFSAFASFVAPFAGFLASAIKRAFKKKDFGSVIPGHGGLTDRMDCQLLMVFFTHFYLKMCFKTRGESVNSLCDYILKNFDYSEIRGIINKLIGA